MSGLHSWSRRASFAGAVLLVTVALPACSPAGPEPGSPPSTTASPSGTSSPTDVRARLVAGLRSTSPTKARLVEKGESSQTPVAVAWLSGWQIFDVQNNMSSHPQRFFVALSDSGRAEVLSGKPATFSAVLTDAGVQVDSAARAAEVGGVFLDVTRDFRVYAYRLDSVDDISWVLRPTAAEQANRDRLVQDYRSRVKPPQVVESGNGWRVTIWMVQGRALVTHELDLATGAPVGDSPETVERDIPVPYSA